MAKYVVSWTARSGGSAADNEAAVKRSLQVFGKWSPPNGSTFHEFVQRIDGNGGYAVVETENPLNILGDAAKFGPFFEFKVDQVVDMMEAIPVSTEAIEYRDSIT